MLTEWRSLSNIGVKSEKIYKSEWLNLNDQAPRFPEHKRDAAGEYAISLPCAREGALQLVSCVVKFPALTARFVERTDKMNNLRQREVFRTVSETASSPLTEHVGLTEMSNMAAVAAMRLQTNPAPTAEDVRTLLEILRGVENIGLVSFLRRHGTEDNYRAIGAGVARRYAHAPPRRR